MGSKLRNFMDKEIKDAIEMKHGNRIKEKIKYYCKENNLPFDKNWVLESAYIPASDDLGDMPQNGFVTVIFETYDKDVPIADVPFELDIDKTAVKNILVGEIEWIV